LQEVLPQEEELQNQCTFFIVRKNTRQERNLQFFPLRKSKALEANFKLSPDPRGPSEQEFHLPVLTHERISTTGHRASQISSQRTNLSLNLSTCYPNARIQPAMLDTPVLGPSAPLIGGAEGISFPMEEFKFVTMDETFSMEMNNSTPCTMGVESTLNTGKHLYRDFNTLTSALNTPEITDSTFDEKFDEFFTRNDFGNEAMKTFETPMNEPFTVVTDFSQPEEIWGYQTFNDDDDFGMCAPPSVVEGTVDNTSVEETLMTVEEPVEVVVEEAAEPTFDIENNDVLKWIIDDQQIDDLPIFDNSQPELTPALHSVSVNLPESSGTTSFFLEEIPEASQSIKVEVKTEDLGEDEKYRKMRSQNNEASRKCRFNRKRKQADMEIEVDLLQERNTFLKARLEEMEQEVQAWKKKLLSDISTTSTNNSFRF